MGTGLIAYSTRTTFTRSFKKHGKVIPEARLPPMIVGAVVLPIGLFWFAWYESMLEEYLAQLLTSRLGLLTHGSFGSHKSSRPHSLAWAAL